MLSRYAVEAALDVARRLCESDLSPSAVSRDILHAATQGQRPAQQLRRAITLLDRAELLLVDENGRLLATDVLRTITSVPDEQAILELARILEATLGEQPAPAASREEVGALAEQAVIDQCREDLTAFGREDLARRVSQVSLISDRFGYDVIAPTLDDHVRHLEVKGSTNPSEHLFTFYLTRNEYDVGRKDPDWSLVACAVHPGTVTILGHITALPLDPFLPEDRSGRWSEAFLRLPKHLLLPALPSAIP